MKNTNRIKVSVMMMVLCSLIFVLSYEVSALTKQIFITVKVNGNCIKMDTEPYMKDNRTYVSIRFVAEALGAKVEWNAEERRVKITDQVKTIDFTIGSNEVQVNSEKKIMDTAVEIVNNRTMVPARFISENLGCLVEWNGFTYSMLVTKNDHVVPESYIKNRSYTDDDILWLARIVSVEARDLSIDGKVAVANVIINRKNNSSFPNTIYDVIFDRAYNVQFPPAYKTGFKELTPSSECAIASKMALEGVNNIDKALFFNNVPFKSRTLCNKIEGEYFYY